MPGGPIAFAGLGAVEKFARGGPIAFAGLGSAANNGIAFNPQRGPASLLGQGGLIALGAFQMSVRQYSLYNPVPWMNGGGPNAFAGFGAGVNEGIAFGGFWPQYGHALVLD